MVRVKIRERVREGASSGWARRLTGVASQTETPGVLDTAKVELHVVSMVPLGVGLRCTRTDLRSRRRVASPSGLSGVVCVVRTLIVYLRSSVARLTVGVA